MTRDPDADFWCAVDGKNVIVRVDHNVPMRPDGALLDDTRLRVGAESLRELSRRAKKLLILSHRGDPGAGESLSLRACYDALKPQLRAPTFCPEPNPEAIRCWMNDNPSASTVYVENVRQLNGEKREESSLIAGWAALAQVYVADAFSVVHREHASTTGLAKALPSFAGPTLRKDIDRLRSAVAGHRRLGFVIGGAKRRTKMPLAIHLAKSHPVALVGLCGVIALQEEQPKYPPGLVLTVDDRCLPRHDSPQTPLSWQDLSIASVCDTGPRTLLQALKVLAHCDVIVWNGPLGAYEDSAGRSATALLADFLQVRREKDELRLIAGGGDTLAALALLNRSHVPDLCLAAGGAMLACIASDMRPPGLTALSSYQLWESSRLSK